MLDAEAVVRTFGAALCLTVADQLESLIEAGKVQVRSSRSGLYMVSLRRAAGDARATRQRTAEAETVQSPDSELIRRHAAETARRQATHGTADHRWKHGQSCPQCLAEREKEATG